MNIKIKYLMKRDEEAKIFKARHSSFEFFKASWLYEVERVHTSLPSSRNTCLSFKSDSLPHQMCVVEGSANKLGYLWNELGR